MEEEIKGNNKYPEIEGKEPKHAAEVLGQSKGAAEGRGSLPKKVKFDGHVLLVEDNLINQEVMIIMLKSLGCSVDVAVNGVEALKIFSQNSYALVLMDCRMPEMDGYEATMVIRSREKSGKNRDFHVPIIAITGSAREDDREKCLAAGMDDYLSKPFDMSQLITMLERWLPKKIQKIL